MEHVHVEKTTKKNRLRIYSPTNIPHEKNCGMFTEKVISGDFPTPRTCLLSPEIRINTLDLRSSSVSRSRNVAVDILLLKEIFQLQLTFDLMADSVKIEVHRRMDSEDNGSDGGLDYYEPFEDDQEGHGSSELESEPEPEQGDGTVAEEDVEQRQLSYPPIPVYKSPMPSPAKDRIGLLTPTEELSEGEQSVVASARRHSLRQRSGIEIADTSELVSDEQVRRSRSSELPARRVSFNPADPHPFEAVRSIPRNSPDLLEEDDAEQADLDILDLNEDMEDLISLQSRQELVLNWQEKHLQHHLSHEDLSDILQSSAEMDPSSIMKSLRTVAPSNFAPVVQQMTDSLSAYQSHLTILNTISLFGDRLRELQPFEYNLDLLPLLKKLCTLVGETRSTSADLSAAVTLSKLIRGAGPALVTADLLYIINGSNMKRKPAAMDGLTFALLTFPRDDFDIEKIAEAVSHCLWNPKRRIRQAALECLAVVAHVLGPGIAMPFLRELIEQNRPMDTSENPSSAVSARVSRRLLPSASPMGLIEYGLPLPSKQFSKQSLEQLETGGLDPILSKSDYGPDILWILHGADQSKMNSARSSLTSRDGPKSSKSSSAVRVGRVEIQEQHGEILRQKHRECLAFVEEETMKEKVEFRDDLGETYDDDLNSNSIAVKTTPRDRDSGVSSLKSVRIASPTESISSSKSLVPDEGGPAGGPFSSPPSTGQSDDLDDPFVIRRPVMARSSRPSITSLTSQTGRVQHSPPLTPRRSESPPLTPRRADSLPLTPRRTGDEENRGGGDEAHVMSPMTEQAHWLKKSCPTKIPPRKSKSKPRDGGATGRLVPPLKSPHDSLPPKTSRSNDSPKHLLAQALTQLNSPEWEVTVDGFGMLTRLLRTHPEFLRSELPTVNRAALLHLSNLRSQVTRAACHFFEDLFVTYGKSMEQDCEKIAEKLLDKTADTNKFIREASTSALESMAMHLPPPKTIICLENYGSRHRNTIVRSTTAHVTRLLVQQLGAEKILNHNTNAQKVLPMLVKFLQEGSLETRTHAKHGLACLVVHGSFESALKRYIPSSTLKQVEKSISSIKHDVIRKG